MRTRSTPAYIEAAVEDAGEAVVEALKGRQPTGASAKLKKLVARNTAAAVIRWRERAAPAYKREFVRDIQRMILLMPKQELASLAQELINLTSVKRKFSSETESVGGPIDVALISRTDGFVWVRRKHYFEPHLNPRYFYRKFGTTHSEGQHS